MIYCIFVHVNRIQQRQLDAARPEDDIVVNHVHPGFVDTDMTKHMGQLSIDEGAKSSVWAALLPPKTDIRGQYIWEDCTVKDWVNERVAVVTGSNKGIGFAIVKGNTF